MTSLCLTHVRTRGFGHAHLKGHACERGLNTAPLDTAAQLDTVVVHAI